MASAFTQIAAVTTLNLQNIKERIVPTLVALLGIAGVVTVLVGVLSISEGFRAVLERAGSDDVAVVLRKGATDEMSSSLTQEQARLLADLPEVARSAEGALVSPELYVVVDVPLRATNTIANVPMRGVAPNAGRLRQGFRIVEGRAATPGTFEIIVGRGAAVQFAGLDVGRTVRLGSTDWLVAGRFADNGSVAESEIWTDATVLQGVFQRGSGFQSARVQLTNAAALKSFEQGLANDNRLKLRVFSERAYYQEQSQLMTAIITNIGTSIAGLMGLGAIFAALNTMYSAVSARTREIATLRAIGFGAGPIVMSVLTEATLIGLVGGLLGMLIAYVGFDGINASTMNYSSFSQVTFAFDVTPQLLGSALILALVLGLIGGSLPCIRAARLPITTGLREL